jgi:hypothetical protein
LLVIRGADLGFDMGSCWGEDMNKIAGNFSKLSMAVIKGTVKEGGKLRLC